MTDATTQYWDRVLERSLPYWHDEFVIGFRAFQCDTIYYKTGWLAHQIAKEWHGSGVYGPAGTDLEALTTTLSALSAQEEKAHFDMLRALGRQMPVPPGTHQPGRAAALLTQRRNTLWDDAKLRHAVRMSEGGGLGLFHGALAAIKARGTSRAQDDAVRTTMLQIIADEAGHLGNAIATYVEAELTDDDRSAIVAELETILSLKVAERKEQFSGQLGGNPADWPEAGDAARQYEADIKALLAPYQSAAVSRPSECAQPIA